MISAQRQKEQPRLAVNEFSRRLGDYKRWRDELIEIINEYQTWVESHGLASGEEDLQLYELIDALRSDKLTVALVAEFSRGKTELINAIFFADYRQRLLPSEAGRTTMCPTELRWDNHETPCLKLLPIETRETATTISEYRRTPEAWTVLPLDLDSPRNLAETFQQTVKTKPVSRKQAEALGLYRHDVEAMAHMLNGDGSVEIPVWRHAIINFPHPMLKQGLVVLDTPGLNALGTEPELTLSMLPNAQAVLFVLAADTGVTKTDMEVWNHHVCPLRGSRDKGRLVVLNKIDYLWDELSNDTAIAAAIARQTQETARTLGVSKNQVLALSAQKGLLGKIKTDHALIERSGLPALEAKLSDDIIPARRELLRERVIHDIGSMVETTSAMIEARLTAVTGQIEELQALGGENNEAIQDLVTRLRDEKLAYDQTLASFQGTRAVLSDHIKILFDYLSVETFDDLADRTRQGMSESWTTSGLREAMKSLFDGALDAMERANKQTQQIRSLVQAIYHKFHSEHGLAKIKPVNFSLLPYRSQLQKLYEEAEAFRNSPLMVITEQHFVVQKFFVTLVGRAREIFSEANAAARAWSKAIMAPILSQVREHKILMDQRLENLKKVHENFDNLSDRIAELESGRQNLENQQLVIRNMLRKINKPLPVDP
ncbi:GTPase [Sulfuricaulis limicola]|uniref:GTPase n=1 Tax=Sulfuricaulis limicola TaxID=1620215 RepID=A0A1B4XIV1_9GAMM|nr:dynamin family protein [Sulfuricaulis limicola]BAV34735.1 GTPase [Sulfuricaulis limicola]